MRKFAYCFSVDIDPSRSPTHRYLLKDAHTNCNQSDIAANYVYVLGIVTVFKSKVPSVYFLGDVLLALDEKFGGKLLKSADQNMDAPDDAKKMFKLRLSLKEAGKLKKIVGYLRYLYRNSKTRAKNKKVQALKLLLQPRGAIMTMTTSASVSPGSLADALALTDCAAGDHADTGEEGYDGEDDGDCSGTLGNHISGKSC